jgi:hypothetical protein
MSASVAKFTSLDIGNPTAGTTAELTPGKYFDIKGYGSMFGLHTNSDMGRFVYTRLSGDFDISVRVANFVADSSTNSTAGLMVRKGLEPDDLFFALGSATNAEYSGPVDIATLLYRKVVNSSECPINFAYGSPKFSPTGSKETGLQYPNVWVRITRVGNTYTGYLKNGTAGKWEAQYFFKAEDGPVAVGCHVREDAPAVTVDLGEQPYVGMFITANEHGGGPTNGVKVEFRDLKGFAS